MNSTQNNNTAAGIGSVFHVQGASALGVNIPAGEIIIVEATSNFHATLTAATGFTNSGEIRLDSTAGTNSTLIVTSGTLTKIGRASCRESACAGGARTIIAELTNLGTVNINVNTTFNKTTITNQNNFHIADGVTL